MTREDALGKWTHCVQVCERAGNYFAEENDGPNALLARKLRPYPDAVIEEVKPTGIWPSGAFTGILKVTHVAERLPRPAVPGPDAVIIPGKPAMHFYLAVRKEG